MDYYLAPLEGITTYIYRNACHRYFPPMNKYFTPFLMPHEKRSFNTRELNEILPEHNRGLKVVPQILTNQAGDFIRLARELERYGYEEVNLNLGCPSGTVVSKNRGSGFLALQKELDRFLYQVCEGLDMKISVKTRIGKDSPDEFYELIEIFNRYALEELIIHPRVQKDFYKNHPNQEVFGDALRLSKNKVCYNGDLFTPQDYRRFTNAFPQVDTVMMGRGIVFYPGFLQQIQTGEGLGKEQLMAFQDRIYNDYTELYQGGPNALFKMKELWSYMIHLFEDFESYYKRMKKAKKPQDYEAAVADLFRERPLINTAEWGV